MTNAVEKRLLELGNGLYAYFMTPGSWGYSNSGLIVDGEHALLVDTLFDTAHTRQMLDEMRRVTPAADRIGTVVNTHANGDHCWGNALVPGAEIVASRECAEEMLDLPPSQLALLMRAESTAVKLGGIARGLGRLCGAIGVDRVAWLVEAAPFATATFRDFDFRGIELTPPTRTFEGRLDLRVGDVEVQLIEVGPAHTRGDVLVNVPGMRTVFTGDILFADAHPLAWEGPVANWISACKKVLDLDPVTVVPGHGELTDTAAIERQLEYFEYISNEARQRYDAGLSVEEAARDISLTAFDGWLDAERIYINVHTLYRDFVGDRRRPDPVEMFAGMAKLRKDWGLS
jgi:glyoxylase-like metal-dependent hydrolase (beta-lactamase superfamily II)